MFPPNKAVSRVSILYETKPVYPLVYIEPSRKIKSALKDAETHKFDINCVYVDEDHHYMVPQSDMIPLETKLGFPIRDVSEHGPEWGLLGEYQAKRRWVNTYDKKD